MCNKSIGIYTNALNGLHIRGLSIKGMKGNRKLAAIMFTDIVGYTTLISRDEDLAVNYLVENKNKQKQILRNFRGQLWKDLGDGIMVTFDTIRDAVRCGEVIISQTRADNHLNLRIGIHLCDITEREGDIYGEGVNIASRIMEQAGNNEIFISEAAYLTLCNHNIHKVEFKGRKRLKNLPEVIGIYELVLPESQRFDSNQEQISFKMASITIACLVGPTIVNSLSYIFPAILSG